MPIINKIIIRLVCLTFLLLSVGSCRDEIDIPGGEIPEGWARVTLNVDFTQFMPTRLGSRSAGDTFDEMRKLWVLVYDKSGTELLKTKEMSSKIETGGQKAEDTMELPFGEYQIYAVANVDDLLTTYANEIKTANGLKNIRLEWVETVEGLGRNDQMMDYFTVSGSSSAVMPDNPVIRIDKRETTIESKVIRAASKVTVAYDGSDLKDGVKIYIKSLRIKNIPRTCLLGAENTVKSKEDLIENGEEIDYAGGAAFNDNHPGLISNQNPYFPRRNSSGGYDDTNKDPHAHTADGSLFFYENLQGTGPDKQQKDENGDGVLDELFPFKDKPYATYIEVEAYYESVNPERPGVSDITYRFALGNNIVDNYDATRNHHYKLTLHFNGYAIEPDWRIDYVKFFGVSQPHDVNYQGKFFVPDSNIPNFGHTFSDQNIITINSYMFNKEDETQNWIDHIPVGYDIEYSDSIGDGQFSEFSKTKPAWFGFEDIATEAEKNTGVHKLKLNYACKFGGEVDIDSILQKTTAITKDLSLVDGKMNTANSYIVSSKGTYTLPLVYGNAIRGGADNKSAYSGFGTGDRILSTFENYLAKPITSPYIIEDAKNYASIQAVGTISTELVWEDVEGLVDLSSIKYVPTLYGNNGGIQFTISSGINQGNAVIAIKNGDKIMWSWHIWVTAFDLDRIVTLTNHQGVHNEIMPINLGWCSNGGKIRYYDRHVCYMRFTQNHREGEDENAERYTQTIKIVQEPHNTIPIGNNTYFQWGRKDPFVGSNSSWNCLDWWYESAPGVLTKIVKNDGSAKETLGKYLCIGYRTLNPIGIDKNDRLTTMQSLGRMIQNPNCFNNPRFKNFKPGILDEKGNMTGGEPGTLDDEIYSNLWSHNLKTIYDPCPYGYRVSPYEAYTGFTSTGWGMWESNTWYNVDNSNMLPGYTCVQGVYEFYTNKSKLISAVFPMTGYLDYDAIQVYNFTHHGYCWEDTNRDNSMSDFLKFVYDDGTPVVNQQDGFYCTDATSIRPLKMANP